MKRFKRALGVAMSVAMLGVQALPVMAAAGTAATGNILDYKVETVVVPTTMKIALNPNGYTITTKYVKTADAAVAEGKTYYTEDDGTYKKVSEPNVTNIATYYEAVTSTDQVVSLNYGIVNKSTDDKTVKVEIAASYEAVADKTAITFVDTAEKATGAEKGELKMYLAVVSANALPTASTYVKATEYAEGTAYYTKENDGTFKTATVNDDTAFKAGTFYTETTAIGLEITAAQLSDVTMTKAEAGAQVFAKGTTNKADAAIAYKLAKATYALKDGEVIDFGTTQTQLADKLEMTGIGGVAGFTLTGALNANCDWSEADATAITFTPTYTITDVAGTETAVENTYNQVSLKPAESMPSIAVTTYETDGTKDVIITVDLGKGDLKATGIDSITFVSALSGNKTMDTKYYNLEGTTLTITKDQIYAWVSAGQESRVYTIIFNDNAKTAVEVTFNNK